MSGHIADLVSRQDLRDVADERIRRLASDLEISGDFDPFIFTPPGPVAQAFINSPALTAIIMGPLGGGKTTACMYKRLVIAGRGPIAWHPRTRKPTRMCKGIVLRDTFRQTEKTVLASWHKAFPRTFPASTTVGGNDRPLTSTLNFRGLDGVPIEVITEFAGLGEQSIETMLKGTEYSFGWLNEVDTHADGAIDDLEQRLGRYPSADTLLTERELAEFEAEQQRAGYLQGGARLYAPEARMRALIGDMNAPTIDNWTYETLVTNRKPDREFFQQPSGLSPQAENIFALEKGYYERIVENQDERFVDRMVHNKFGYSRAGKPVHPSFDHVRHVASTEIPFTPQLDLVLGCDISTGGLSPAAILAQHAAQRIKFIDELYLGHGVGAARFAEALAMLLQERYPNLERRRLKFYPDPAALAGADKEAGELNAAEIIATRLGVPILVPGNGSNEISLRLGAVDAELRGYLEPNTSLLISPRCSLYIAAIAGKYRFKKKPESSSNEYDELPEKAHPWSDVQDAGQYAIIGIRGHRGVMRGLHGKSPQGGSGRFSTQDGEAAERGGAWKSQAGFDPHSAGVKG